MTVFPTDRPLTEEEKQRWMLAWLRAKAVGWEAYALAHAIASLVDDPPPMVRTLLLEAALTHQRCLIEFLIGRSRNGQRTWNPRDVEPRSIHPSWDPVRSLEPSFQLLENQMNDIDSLLAHVSRRRLKISYVTWDLAPVTKAIFEGLTGFVSQLYAIPVFAGRETR